MCAMLMIPRLESDLTPAWLSEALRRNITAVKTEPIGIGIGLVGTVFGLDLDGDDGPARMIAKLAAPTEDGRFVATVLNMYGREVGFYNELSPQTPISHPACYYCAFDPTTQDTVLLLEDVARHGVMLDQIKGCMVADTGPFIRTLARLHARFWEDPSLAEYEFLLRLSDDPYPGAVSFAYSTAWPVAQELFRDQMTPQVLAFGDGYGDRIAQLFAKLCDGPLVLSHADWRLDNLFQTSDNDVIAVDWQLIDRSVPLRDLAYFVTGSVDMKTREEHGVIFDAYLAALAEHDLHPDRNWAWEMYRYGILLSFVYPIIAAGALTIADARHVELTATILRRALAALDALDGFALPL
jgi:hypothetical protein